MFALLNRNLLSDLFFILLHQNVVPCLFSPKIQVLLSGLLKPGKNLAFSAPGASKENT